MSEQTYTVVGTAKSASGVIKVRWTNDLIGHFKRVHRKGCTDIDFHETPNPMTKLEALDWVIKNKDLTEEQQEIIYIKKAEKSRQRRLQRTKTKEEV
jgi:hypothetical protein